MPNAFIAARPSHLRRCGSSSLPAGGAVAAAALSAHAPLSGGWFLLQVATYLLAGLLAGLLVEALARRLVWFSDATRVVRPAAPEAFPWRSVRGEFVELLEEIRARDVAATLEELGDFLATAGFAIHDRWVDLPVPPLARRSVAKYAARREAWNQVARAYGGQMETHMLRDGNNMARAEKRALILSRLAAGSKTPLVLTPDLLPEEARGYEWPTRIEPPPP